MSSLSPTPYKLMSANYLFCGPHEFTIHVLNSKTSISCGPKEKIYLPVPTFIDKGTFTDRGICQLLNLCSNAYPHFLLLRCFSLLPAFLPPALLPFLSFSPPSFTYRNNQLHIVFIYKSVTGRKTATK